MLILNFAILSGGLGIISSIIGVAVNQYVVLRTLLNVLINNINNIKNQKIQLFCRIFKKTKVSYRNLLCLLKDNLPDFLKNFQA
jgi:hypothetical protein